MRDLVIHIYNGCKCAPSKPKPKIGFAVGLARKKGNMPLEVLLTNEQEVDVNLNITTESGKPAEVDGKPKWTRVSGDSEVIVAEDGKSAVLRSSDTPGDSTFLVEADADLGEGVQTVSDTVTLKVQGAQAKNLGLSVGTPRPKPGV